MTELVNNTTGEDAKKGRWDYADSGGALDPEGIAGAILYACQVPQRICLCESVICPTNRNPERLISVFANP